MLPIDCQPQKQPDGPESEIKKRKTNEGRNMDFSQGQQQCPVDFGMTQCCPASNDNSRFHTKFRTKVVGGKLIKLPETNWPVYQLRPLNGDFNQSLCLQHDASLSQSSNLPAIGGKSCSQNYDINQPAQNEPRDRMFVRTPCRPAYQEVVPQAGAMKRPWERDAQGLRTNTPMSLFHNDERFLKRTIATYHRDQELAAERGLTSNVNTFSDGGSQEWHEYMVHKDRRCLPGKTENELLKRGCYRIPDRCGGYCYLCPNTPEQDGTQKDGAMSSQSSDSRCNRKTSQGKPDTSKREKIQTEINSTIDALNQTIRDRELLHNRLMNTEEPMHKIRERFYSIPVENRHKDRNTLQQMKIIETCQKELMEELHQKERKVSDLLQMQNTLEKQLNHQIIEESQRRI